MKKLLIVLLVLALSLGVVQAAGTPENPELVTEIINGQNGFNRLDGPTAIEIVDNLAYVISGNSNSLTIIDVSDPENPVKLSEIYNGGGLSGLSGLRDVFVSGDYAYLLSFGSDKAFAIVNVSDPSNPFVESRVYNGDGEFDVMTSPNQIYVEGNYAYITSFGSFNDPTHNALIIADVSDPTNPEVEFAGLLNRNSHLYNPEGIVVRDDIAYIASNSNSRFVIYDVQDPSNPIKLGAAIDGANGFDKLWGAIDVDIEGDYAYVASSGDRSITTIDISDPTNPTLASEIYSGDGEFTRLDRIQRIDVANDIVFASAWDYNTVTIIDMADKSDPGLLSQLSDGNDGFNNLNNPMGLRAVGQYLYVTSIIDDTVNIIDIGPPQTQCSDVDIHSYWKFDENQGTLAQDSKGDNHATIDGAAWTTGRVNSALDFDGTNDAVVVGDVEVDDWTELTVSAWVKTTSTARQRIVAKDQVGTPGNFILWYNPTFDWEFLAYDDSDSEWKRAQYASTAENDGQWHHVLGTVNQIDDEVKLYIDGDLKATVPFNAATLDDSDNEEIVIGADSDVGSHEDVFDGTIDEVAIYDRALSETEISDIYGKGLNDFGVCESPECIDGDSDGFGFFCAKGVDCNDSDASVHPPENAATYTTAKTFCPGTYSLPDGFTYGGLQMDFGDAGDMSIL